MPPCYHMRYVTISGKLLASQLANIQEMQNTKYDGFCKFPVSLDMNGLIIDFQYCVSYDESSRIHQAIKLKSNQLVQAKFASQSLHGISAWHKNIKVCRSGWSYGSQFVDGLTIDFQLVSLTKEEETEKKNGVVRNTYAQCNERMIGTWSEWSEDNHEVSLCSKSCGGGKVQRFRTCLYPPCDSGLAFEETEKSCNKHDCADQLENSCFYGNGFMYRGTVSKPNFLKSSRCLPWSLIGNHSTEAFPGWSLEGSSCRNPDHRAAPYCYTKFEFGEIEWEYCDIPRCSTNATEISVLPMAILQTRQWKDIVREWTRESVAFKLLF